MLSNASERLNRTPSRGARVQGAMLALLVQVLFILALVTTRTTVETPHSVVNETLLLLHALPRPAPPPRPATAPNRLRRPAVPLIIPAVPSFTPAPQLAPPSGIAGFGRSLFGCAPEHYADLPPDEKAHCPKPGEGLAVNALPDLMTAHSHVKDEAHWRQEWARVHGPTRLPCGFVDIAAIVYCLLTKIADGSLDDFGDPKKWPVYAVKQLPDRDFRKIEEAYQAWHKAHPIPPPKN